MSIRVVVVDDSAIIRQALKSNLNRHADIEVVGTAMDPFAAREVIAKHRPDVITLDIEMPRMDGLTFLTKLMASFPLPTIVLSSLTPEQSDMAMDALSRGAVDVMHKPGGQYDVSEVMNLLADKIRIAAQCRVKKLSPPKNASSGPVALKQTTQRILAVGSSTGGTAAFENLLQQLPATCPGIVLAQHMPPAFTGSFAKRLNDITPFTVSEAAEGDIISPGRVYIAPGDYHLLVKRSGGNYVTALTQTPRVHFQRPAVEILFESCARSAGANAMGVILTGMGKDGAQGMLSMKNAGAHTIAQDEASCVVYGMPREAMNAGAVCEQVSLGTMGQAIIKVFQSMA